MAGAAAKKAAAARKAAKDSYLPIFLGLNVVYVLLRLGSAGKYTIWSYLGIIICLGLNYACYTGILDASETHNQQGNSKDLVGGVWLDVWVLTVLVQFGTALLSSKFYYLLLVLPPWGIYKLYSNFVGVGSRLASSSGGGGTNANNRPAAEVDEKTAEKRRKRAERRRQKWS